MINSIKTTNDYDTALKNNKLVLIDFYADWCGPCKVLAPIIEKFGESHKDQIAVYKANVDDDEIATLAQTYKIRSIPTLLWFKDGEVVATQSGLSSEDALSKTLQSYI
jgi:thioredoxin 1